MASASWETFYPPYCQLWTSWADWEGDLGEEGGREGEGEGERGRRERDRENVLVRLSGLLQCVTIVTEQHPIPIPRRVLGDMVS